MRPIRAPFAPRQVARLAGSFARARRINRLVDDAAAYGRVLVEEFPSFSLTNCVM